MTQRVQNHFKLAPEGMKAMMALEASFASSGLDHALLELVRLRVSQINGCAYCIHMHTTDLRKGGETEMRLYMLTAWRESPLYSAKERAALGWAESLTLLAETGAPDSDYQALRAEFSEPEQVMRLDELTLTLTLALERLSPLERAAFLLHDVFDEPLHEVAQALDRDDAAVRQLAARARKHVRAARPRYPVGREEGGRIARAFFDASSTGDVSALRTMLAETVTIQSDGGGKVMAFLNPIVGMERVLHLYEGLNRKFPDRAAVYLGPAWIDGLPGYIARDRDGGLQTVAVEIDDGLVTAVYITRNPDKLSGIAGLAH